jgi:ketosteroid isomerase-like protein
MTLILLLLLATTPEADLKSVLTTQSAAWNRGDLDGFLAPYWHSEELSFFSNGTATKGFAATAERYRKRYGTAKETMGHLDFDNLQVTMLGPEGAAIRGRFKLQMKDSNPTGIFTLLLRKIDGKWTIIHDHTSTDK